MTQQNRSKQYDWFKGKPAKGAKKSPKENAKVVWKFTKIFIYLSLFIFALTGCIQTLIIKTKNNVGDGSEFFSSEKEVAPSVATIQVTKTLLEGNDIYAVSGVNTDYWLNDKAVPNSEPGSLEAVHAAVLAQNEEKNLKLEDAYKGSNKAVRIIGEVEPKGVSVVDNQPLVLSSIATHSNFGEFNDNDKSLLSGFHMFDASTSTYSELSATSLLPYDSDEIDYAYNAGKYAPEGGYGDVKEKNVNINKTRQAYSLSVLKGILNSYTGFSEWMKNSFWDGQGGKEAFDKLSDSTKSAIIAQGNAFSAITNIIRLNFATKDEESLFFIQGQYPYIQTSSDWRPYVTWADAWEAGPFYGIFVYPIAEVTAKMIDAMPLLSGWEALITIFMVVFAIRILSFLLTFKSTLQQTRMQELSAKKAVIDAKYAPYKGNKQMENRQRQEVSEMYKKEGISPLGSMTSIFITMPFFLAIWRTIGSLPHVKSAVWLGINFASTSWRELFAGSFQYLPLMIVAAAFAAFQQILPRLLTKRRDKNRINIQQKAAMKKGNKTQNIMMVVFVFMAIIFSAGLQVYWIAGGTWMIIQSFITHHLIIRNSKKRKKQKVKV